MLDYSSLTRMDADRITAIPSEFSDPTVPRQRRSAMANAPVLPSALIAFGFAAPDRSQRNNVTPEHGQKVRRAANLVKRTVVVQTGVAADRMTSSDANIGSVGASSDAARMTGLLSLLKAAPDEAVFAELFRYYAPRLKSYMRKLGAAEDVAEELAQEAMASVWRKAHMFDAEKAGAGTWIFSIARNLRIDAFRRQRRPEVDFDDPALVPDDPTSPDVALDQERQAIAVRSALASLPQEQARIVHLSFFEDKPHAAIAHELGIPLGTVKSRMRLAFQRFRKALGEPEL